MAPPSSLVIATSSVQRLVKEEASYHKELEQQQARIAKLEQGGGDENADFTLRQERKAVEETKAIFPSLKERIKAAVEKLENELDAAAGSESNVEEVTKAKEAISQAKTSYREIA